MWVLIREKDHVEKVTISFCISEVWQHLISLNYQYIIQSLLSGVLQTHCTKKI